jgi:predicted HicB family RNase H-like nuclease
VRLPKELVTAAKHRALDQGLTLRELVERALREYVRKQS